MLAECPGNFVLTTKYVYLCYKNPAPVGNAFVAVRLEYGNIRSVYRYLLQDRICIEVGDPNVGTKSTSSRVTVEFFKQDMCNTAFHELAWFCHFHNRDEELISKSIGLLKKDIRKYYKENQDHNFQNYVYDSIFHIPCVFNSGCVIGKRGMTCIEIENGNISLVHWFDKKNK